MINKFKMKSVLSVILSVVFMIQPKHITVIGQNVGIQDESGGDLQPQAWNMMPPLPTANLNDDSSTMQHDQLPVDEWNGQEPMRRRRRPGRKRKRRPQHGPLDIMPDSGGTANTYWQKDDIITEPDDDNHGVIMSVSSSQHFQNNENTNWHTDGPSNGNRRRTGQNWHINKNQYVHEQVVRVQNQGPEYDPPRRTESKLREPYPTQSMDQQQLHTGGVPPQIPHLTSYRKPYSVAKKEREEQHQQHQQQHKNQQQHANGNAGGSGSATNLKDLLKQSGGMSLSEILQQQNLSLDDLLKGKQNALKALQSTTTAYPIQDFQPADVKPTRRIPIPLRSSDTFTQNPLIDDKTQKRRIPQFSRPKTVDATMQVPTNNDSVKVIKTEMIPTQNSFASDQSVPATIANIISDPTQRRLPGTAFNERTKPIKEIVSGIRPDLNNLNTRKRLLPLTLKTVAKNQTIGTHLNRSLSTENMLILSKANKELNNLRPTDSIRLPPRYLSANRKNPLESPVSTSVTKEDITTMIPTTITSKMIPHTEKVQTTERTPDVIKDIVKNRLALRPKLRLPIPTKESTTSTTDIPKLIEIEQTEEPTVFTTKSSFDNEYTPSSSTTSATEIQEEIEKYEPEVMNAIEEQNFFDIEEDLAAFAFTSKMDKMMEQSDDIDRGTEKLFITENSIGTTIDRDVTELNPSLFADITSSKSIDDRTDLLELLDDRRSGARLQKVLSQRNMTLEELIEHRKRGSSQLHLAEIYNNKTGRLSIDGPTGQNLPESRSLDIVTAFENFPTFNLNNLKSVKPDDIKTDSQGSSYFTSITNIKPTDEIFKEGRSLLKPTIEVSTAESHRNFAWDPPVYATRYGLAAGHNYVETSNPSVVTSSRLSPASDNQYPDMIEFENDIDHPHDIIDLELSGYGFKRNAITVESATPAQMPVGVRSAIIASSSIVGVSVMIFVIIFATCRWRQRRRKKITYNENFQAVRSRLPILTRQTSSNHSKRSTAAAPIIFPSTTISSSNRHHHHSSKLNTMDPNSPEVQEYLYDAMRKPF